MIFGGERATSPRPFLLLNYDMKHFSFASAIPLLQQGLCITRAAFRDCFVFRQIPQQVTANVVPMMTSLPAVVKDIFMAREQGPSYRDQLALVLPNGEVTGWTPSPEDTLANDWMIYDTLIVRVYQNAKQITRDELQAVIDANPTAKSVIIHVMGYTLGDDEEADKEELVENLIEDGLFLEANLTQLASQSGLNVVEVTITNTTEWEGIPQDKENG